MTNILLIIVIAVLYCGFVSMEKKAGKIIENQNTISNQLRSLK